jgi:hypothetical protein
MTRSLEASLTKGNVLSRNAYTEICLRPRFTPKRNGQWYDFIYNGGRLTGRNLGYFDPDNENAGLCALIHGHLMAIREERVG